MTEIPTFATLEEAEEWMEQQVDDSCVDNHRYAKCSDGQAVEQYRKQEANGCCGFFDAEVMIAGELWLVGCNYGH